MKILILYGTTEGQTLKIARYVRDRLIAGGGNVDVLDANDMLAGFDPSTYDAAIVAASLHMGRYQAAVEQSVRQHHDALNAMLTAFVAVSLAALSTDDDDVRGLAECVAEFQRSTGWSPKRLHHAAGALRYTEYDFFKRWALKYIAWRHGAPTDTSKDHEFTDWVSLGRFADDFLQEVRAALPRADRPPRPERGP